MSKGRLSLIDVDRVKLPQLLFLCLDFKQRDSNISICEVDWF